MTGPQMAVTWESTKLKVGMPAVEARVCSCVHAQSRHPKRGPWPVQPNQARPSEVYYSAEVQDHEDQAKKSSSANKSEGAQMSSLLNERLRPRLLASDRVQAMG